MDLKVCLENLKSDLSNGGVEEDSFAMNCYVIMANEAVRIVKNGGPIEMLDIASEYIALCRNSGIGSLQFIVRDLL